MRETATLPIKDAYSACIGKGNTGLVFTADNTRQLPHEPLLYAPLYNEKNTFIGSLELKKSNGCSPVHYWVSALRGPNDTPPTGSLQTRLAIRDHTIFVINARTSECSVSAKKTSSSPRSISGNASSDSHSEAGSKTVAQPAFKLSVGELLQIIKGFPADALKERALNELKRRCGEGESVQVKEQF